MTLLQWLPFLHAFGSFLTLAAGETGILMLAFART
jgi:hypothetical protein